MRSLYRITSLVRRSPYVSLFFAIDQQEQRPVAMRDIDISSLDNEGRIRACEIVQHEYNMLRREHIPYVMPVLDLKYSNNHLYVIMGQPSGNSQPGQAKASLSQFHTLQELLQSGAGLPGEQLALRWIDNLCTALDALHRQQIIVGDLEPQTIICDGDTYASQPRLMVSWLPLSLRDLLPRPSLLASTTHFSAPEVLLWKTEPRSDIYSLGALLYLLLTGTAPEDATPRAQHRLRSPRELNPRVSSDVGAFVMCALSVELAGRFQSASAMLHALAELRSSTGQKAIGKSPARFKATQPGNESARVLPAPEETSEVTIRLTQLPERSLLHWQAMTDGTQTSQPGVIQQEFPSLPATPPAVLQPSVETARDVPSTPAPATEENVETPLVQHLKQRVTGILPALSHISRPGQGNAMSTGTGQPAQLPAPDESFLKRLQRMVLGEQHHTTTAAVLIETPLRIQPQQGYAIRISLMGRDTPQYHGTKRNPQYGGLSSLTSGALVSIEIRSALYQNFAYVVQQTAVPIPAQGYAAEVTIPMQPLSDGPSGRRDRLHIFFMDEKHHPLYEKPFVVELFISHLVQSGREGHNVLTIPL